MNKWLLSVEDSVVVATLNFQEFMLDWKTMKYLDGSTEWLLVGDCQNLIQINLQDLLQQHLNHQQQPTVRATFVSNHLRSTCRACRVSQQVLDAKLFVKNPKRHKIKRLNFFLIIIRQIEERSAMLC